MNEKILVTGGMGKTGSRLVELLRRNGVDYSIAAHRNLNTSEKVYFDWTKPATWKAAIEGVSAVYLLAPPLVNHADKYLIDFSRFAISRGVRRFVLLSASLLPAGGVAQGRVHQWLMENAVDWAVMRPSWFMQNFSEGQHLPTILSMDKIFSATMDGKVPFISVDDIAAVAFRLLTHKESFNSDFVLTGTELFSYDEIANIISKSTGRTVIHERISIEKLTGLYKSGGLSEAYAQNLAMMDAAIASGVEERITGCVEELIGHPPITFEEFVASVKSVWIRSI